MVTTASSPAPSARLRSRPCCCTRAKGGSTSTGGSAGAANYDPCPPQGTNDIFAGAASMAAQLEKLLDDILAADSKLLLVVPTTTDSKTATVEAYDKLIPAMVQSRAAQGKHIALVDMFGKFTSTPSYKSAYFKSNDELHPNDAGYDLMRGVSTPTRSAPTYRPSAAGWKPTWPA